MELRFTPRLTARGRDAEESVRRHLHGMLSLFVGRPHDANTPAWSLVPMRGESWGVVLYDPADVERLRGTSHDVTVGECRTAVTFGPAVVRLRELIAEGKLPGIEKPSQLFVDDIGHAHPAILHLCTYMYHAAVFHHDPREITGLGNNGWSKQFGQPKPELAAVLKQIAWETMSAEPLSGMQKTP